MPSDSAKAGAPASAPRPLEAGDPAPRVVALDQNGEPAYSHERQLVAQHVADRAQFAAEAVALAQEPRRAVGAPIREFREFERDDVEAFDIAADQRGRLIALQPEAERRRPRQQLVAVGLPAGERDDHRAGLGQRRLVLHEQPGIVDHAGRPNERHRASP